MVIVEIFQYVKNDHAVVLKYPAGPGRALS
jgi:hypothetical protein